MAVSSHSAWSRFVERAERAEGRDAPSVPRPRRPRPWRLTRRLLLTAVAVLVSVAGLPGIAHAEEPDPDGQLPPSLAEALAALSKAYYDAEIILASSQQRQAEIQQSLTLAQAELDKLSIQIGRVASARYKSGTVGRFNSFIGTSSTEELLAGAAISEYLLWRDDTYIREFQTLKAEAESQQALLNTEIELQTKQRDLLDQQKLEAEETLAAQGGLIVTEGYGGTTRPPVQPAPRNPDGSLPADPCDNPDPTTSGCVTFRTYHMLTEAKNAGFLRYVSCFRSGSFGEHPKGRACDFSAHQWGFEARVASGDARTYGDELAAWAVANAEPLGVLYVIWFKQIWTPRLGWHRYSGAGGDPASDHTNHVHISMR